jgi:hypothetical protein
MGNLNGTLENNNINGERKAKEIVNSIDYVYNVTRLPIRRSGVSGIFLFGADNNYPYKVLELAKRSNSLSTAIKTQAKFSKGLGFEGATANDVKNKNVVSLNKNGLTAYQLLNHFAYAKSTINVAIHINYNVLGEAVEFTPISYDFVRLKTKEQGDLFNKYIITNFWHLEDQLQQYGYTNFTDSQTFEKWINDKQLNYNTISLCVYEYNPDPYIVREQIAMSGGIDKYSGQLFYAKNTTDIYQKALFDEVLDDAQFEAEAKLWSLSSVQNSFSLSGILKYFSNMEGNEEFKNVKRKIEQTTGGINAGRIMTVPYLPGTDGIPNNIFEPITLQNIDKLFTIQKEEVKQNINECFNIPKALIGKDTTGNFATQNIEDQFNFYNAITEQYRQDIEIDLTTLLGNSIFESNFNLPIEIKPIEYNIKQNDTINQ